MKNRVKELREERKISQINLAVRIGISQQTISKLEKEKGVPRADVVVKIAKFFNVSIEYLLCLSNSRRNLENHLYLDSVVEKYYSFLLDYQELNATNKNTINMLLKYFIDQQYNERSD